MNKCDICSKPLPPDKLVEISGKWVCAECKPNYLMNLKSGVAPGGESVPPERAAAIQARIKRLNLISFAFAIPGIILQFSGGALLGPRPGGGPTALQGVGGILVIVGFCFYARMKGRSWAFGFLGLLSLIGLLILAFLGKRCQHCGRKESYRSKVCENCGAPV